jgi:hypothetical protein
MSARVVPILPCRELDDVVPFYEALGFEVTYRQDRPYPCLSVSRDGIDLFFGGIAGFVPADSYGSAIVVVPDTGILYDEFAAGLRAAYGKVLVSGIPRMTRPRRKQGMSAGFSVIDPGGNWLRITSGDAGEDEGGPFERVLRNAARQGDSRGDEAAAIKVLEGGLIRHADASDAEKIPVLVYLAELLIRTGQAERVSVVLGQLEEIGAPESELADLKAVM